MYILTRRTREALFTRLCGLLILMLATLSFNGVTSAQGTNPIPEDTLNQIHSLIGATPEQIYKRFGRPARVEQNVVGDVGGSAITLCQYFDVQDGGRLALFYWGRYHVGAVGFDNLNSTRYHLLDTFFPAVHAVRSEALETCIQPDAYHHMPGDSYEWPGQPSDDTMVATVTAKWATRTGGLLFVRWRLDGNIQKVYDPVTGKDRILPTQAIDKLKLLQMVWFPIAGTNDLHDMHPTARADLSTLTFSYPTSPCYSGNGRPVI